MKYKYRILISVFIFFFFKITRFESEYILAWDLSTFIALVYIVCVVLILWEILARFIAYLKGKENIANNKSLYRISAYATLLSLIIVFLFALFYNNLLFPLLLPWCPPTIVKTSLLNDTAQGFVISLLVIAYEIITIYLKSAIYEAKEKEQIQKELVSARYESLKNQVNPHFLFNSFSVLSALVETNSKSAITFISKLSDMYRYILEHENYELVTVKEEIQFLEDYLFLLKERHLSSIIVESNLETIDEHMKIPPMSLQLLVENAVKHNNFSDENPLIISIEQRKNQVIVVENAKNPKKELIKSTGIGLKNLSKRVLHSIGKGIDILEDKSKFQVTLPIAS